GLYTCWWTAWAWTQNAQGYLIDYGEIVVPQPDRRNPNPQSILHALRSFRNEVLENGWVSQDNTKVLPELIFVDAGYKKEITHTFTIESGSKYFPVNGLGSKPNQGKWRDVHSGKNRFVGRNFFISLESGARLVNINVDEYKREVHEGFRITAGLPGSLSLFNAERIIHLEFAKQILSEKQIEEYIPGRGARVSWVQTRRANHYLDCTAYCSCAAAMLGVEMFKSSNKPQVVVKENTKERRVSEWQKKWKDRFEKEGDRQNI
ncbi:MAG: phage terminase large subunit family protein, partial [Nanoarchaeota archaeon]|nr:phage terminase large subunit family protein [Nanoarchaeota archaeon]